MIPLLRKLVLSAAALAFSMSAVATTYSTDYTDLWYAPGQDGWGLNIVQQDNVLFATMYVYGGDSLPRWFVASDLRGTPTQFTGTLYRATGPFYGAPWNPAQMFPPIPVGTMSLSFTSASTATLVYTVDTVQVNKSLVRFSFIPNNLAGNYTGGFSTTLSNCQPGGGVNGAILRLVGVFSVQHGTGNPRFVLNAALPDSGAPVQCVFEGGYAQAGRIGSITNGTWNCPTGANQGTFSMTEIHANRNGLTAIFTAQDQFCRYTGYFGGTRDVR